ncbi:MAG: toxin-antitoxin system HicB family antitoxin [Proteobacteria bacterium]|nr:toxin-antitoxin system HicB family antitoxin [Pseudomonadota bacterium]
MKTTSATYPLRLPASIRAEVAKLARREGISVNQFIALAVAQKVSALNAASWFAERRSRADMKAFDKLMRRKTGEAPRPDDRK